MSLAKNTLKGITWSSISQFGKQIIQYFTTIILASILNPSDFGLIALALIVIGFLNLFKDMGMSAAIIQTDENSEVLYSTVFWANVLIGVLFTIILFITAPLIAQFYNDERIINILRILSPVFLISSISILQKSLFEKKLEFKSLAHIELIAISVGSIVGIGMALTGYGVWSLVFQSISNNLFFSLLIWFKSEFRPKYVFKFKEIKKIFNYSLNLAGYNLFNYFVRNADYLLIGKFLGKEQLGYYYLAYKIMLYPVQNITGIISRVLFPVYSQIKTDILKFRQVYKEVSNAIAFFTFPLMLGILIVSESFVNTFFGSNWNHHTLILLIMILAPVGLMQSVVSTVGSIYMATGKTQYMFFWGIVTGIVYVTGFYIGIQFGVLCVAISYLINTVIFLYPVFAIPFKFIELSVREFFSSFKVILLSSIIMLLLTFLIKNYLIQFLSSLSQLTILIAAGIIFYFTSFYYIDKTSLLGYLKRIKELRI